MPAGNYISWCNKGKDLLSKNDVEFLATNIDQANLDAQETKEVFGPTLVYCRSAMEWQSKNRPSESIGEWIDEQFGTVSKWSVPVLSITRSEYLGKVKSDLFIYQTPSHLNLSEKREILGNINSGLPSMVVASPAGGLDEEVAGAIGIASKDAHISGVEYIASIGYRTDGIYQGIPNTFPIFQPFSHNSVSVDNEVIYSVKGSPALTYNSSMGKQLLFWDAPELALNVPGAGRAFGTSLDQILGSPTPYVLAARKINQMLKANKSLSVEHIDTYNPVMYSAWQLKSGEYRVMAANLEEGINHTADFERSLEVDIPESWVPGGTIIFEELWKGNGRLLTEDHKLPLNLEQADSKLLRFH